MRMKKIIVIITVLAVTAVAALFLIQAGRNGGGEETLYTCPMHPQVVQDKPGSCPICGMDLVPLEKNGGAEEHSGETETAGRAEVYISPYKQQLINIKLNKAEYRTLEKTVTAPGVVAYDPELYSAQLDYITAAQSSAADAEGYGIAGNLKESARQKLRSLGLSDADIKALEKTSRPDRSLIMEDESGNVTVYGQVYQENLASVKRGASAEIRTAAGSGETFTGVVSAVDNVLNRETRSSRVRITVKNRENRLRAEMFVNIRIFIPQGTHLAVPEEAVVMTGERNFVFVTTGDGHFEPREIIKGEKMEGYYIVKKGLKDGELVAVNGNFLIDSESRLKAAVSNMGGHDH